MAFVPRPLVRLRGHGGPSPELRKRERFDSRRYRLFFIPDRQPGRRRKRSMLKHINAVEYVLANPTYRRRKNEGICCRCGAKNPVTETLCEGCRVAAIQRKEEKREAGRCLDCAQGKPAPGRSLCPLCLDLYRASYQSKLQKAIELGLCRRCFCRVPEAGKKTCEICLSKIRGRCQARKLKQSNVF